MRDAGGRAASRETGGHCDERAGTAALAAAPAPLTLPGVRPFTVAVPLQVVGVPGPMSRLVGSSGLGVVSCTAGPAGGSGEGVGKV